MKLHCGECGAPMRLTEGPYGKFYSCVRYPVCRGVHGAHQNSGKPLGIPANRQTIEWRKKAHAVFDPFVKKWFVKRSDGYTFMRSVMGMKRYEAHISRFNIEQCKRLIHIIQDAEKTYVKKQQTESLGEPRK